MLEVWLSIVVISISASNAQVEPCNGATVAVAVDSSGGMLYSPGYPRHYFNSDSCSWLLTAVSGTKVIQIETVDIEVQEHHGTCVDSIAAYDGSNDQAPLLKTWCGSEKAVVQSTGQSLFLKFVTSSSDMRKGFAISYHAIEPFDMACEEGSAKVLSVGTTPVLYHFQLHQNNIRTCQWRFEVESAQRLVLTIVHSYGYLECEEGKLTLYDGGSTTDPEVLRWCDQVESALSAFYPTSSALMVMSFTSAHRSARLRLELTVRAYARPSQEVCDDTRMPALNVAEDAPPVFMALPYATSAGGLSCPVQFHGPSGIRVDVLSENNQAAACGSSPVTVYDGEAMNASSSLSMECWREKRPIYLSAKSVVTVNPEPGKTSIIQVLAANYLCRGFAMKWTTYSDYSFEVQIPMTVSQRIPPFCVARILFEVDEEGDFPRVIFSGRLDRHNRTIFRVYSGNSTSDPVLFELKTGSYVETTFVGTGPQMLVEYTSDATLNADYFKLTSSSSPVRDDCKEVIEMTATTTPQNLSSFNYPNYYPIDMDCYYKISTEIQGHVIHIRILDDHFGGYACTDTLKIMDGSSPIISKRLSTICRSETSKRKFESSTHVMLLVFHSDDSSNRGGWLLQYYSAPPAPEASDQTDGDVPAAAIVGAVLGIIILVLVIVIVYTCVKSRRSGSAAV